MKTPADEAAEAKKKKMKVIGAVGASLVAAAAAVLVPWNQAPKSATASPPSGSGPPPGEAPPPGSPDLTPEYVGWKDFPQVCLGLMPDGTRVPVGDMGMLDVMQYPSVGVFRDTTLSDGGVVEEWNTVSKVPMMVWIDQPKPTDPPRLGVTVAVENPGDWRLWVSFSPFVYAISPPHNFTTGNLSVSEELSAGPAPVLRTAVVQVLGTTGSPVNDVEVAFSSMLRDPDPISLVTDTSGLVTLTCLNADSLDAFVDDETAGCFDGKVRFSAEGVAKLQLTDCATADGGT